MDGNKYFVDTNIIVEFLRGNPNAITYLQKNRNYLVSTIVFGELTFGVENAAQYVKHTKQLKDFMVDVEIIKIDGETAKFYGKIKSELKKIGKPIPDNDIWIAALALQHNHTLVTIDAHFANVNLLQIKKI